MTHDAYEMWKPPTNSPNNMNNFRLHVNKKFKLSLGNYHELWKWSVEEYDKFWEEFWFFSKLKYSKIYSMVVDKSKNISEIPQWFCNSLLNYAENLLQGKDDDIALYIAAEQRKISQITFGELKRKVAKIASALKACGVTSGDRVVGYIPNCALAVEALLATASIGAIWSSTSPEFGVTGVLDRFQQIQPKVIFSVDSVVYNGRTHDHIAKLTNVVNGLPELEKVIILPYTKEEKEIDISHIPNSVFIKDFLSSATSNCSLEFTPVSFDHPLYIMYSSGTTGPPKCMVHSVGGTLIQHLKEHILHGNMNSKDIMLYYTTTGWMMFNWLISVLAVGGSIVLYDGSPFVPSTSVLWDLIDQIGVTILGTGARWIEALEEKSVYPVQTHQLTSLHTILSTGSPLKPTSFDYVYKSIKSDVLLGSITGGTDIISCFAGQNTTLPVYRGEIQSRNLGMAVQSFNDEGVAVFDTAGELVCTKPFPSMPTSFWNDKDSSKYQKSFFQKFPGVWSHGDYCEISSKTGGVLMLGRSDGTLNPSGVRFGSAEIYNIVSATNFSEISDSLCVGQQTKHGERVVLFLKMVDGYNLNDDLVKRIRSSIRQQLSARHVPGVILKINDIPYTASGKKVEVAVKRILNGEDIQQRGAFINPESLDLYYNIPELKQT
ncbi:acetoacetyl-CoA synthetase-like [Hydractinia symbiolongicarpus]|uniref:acetoacetyl-CoA synthetase-like n=1 Tax=Hydractinia symbiolongicarpus TaxID=13093 RepID=UPI002550C19D|nr:acetoacetyl-CoA synthetase-like [Hydractinia symbiolongicarpus]